VRHSSTQVLTRHACLHKIPQPEKDFVDRIAELAPPSNSNGNKLGSEEDYVRRMEASIRINGLE
jgi:hypothetical protein